MSLNDKSDSKQSQCSQVLARLEAGFSVTSMQAFRLFSIVSLPKRICELKAKGYAIKGERIRLPSGKHCNVYSLTEQVPGKAPEYMY